MRKKRKSVLAERGQVTIPKPIRDQLGLRPGSVLIFEVERGRIVLSKEVSADPIERVRGCLPHLRPVDQLIEELRGPK